MHNEGQPRPEHITNAEPGPETLSIRVLLERQFGKLVDFGDSTDPGPRRMAEEKINLTEEKVHNLQLEAMPAAIEFLKTLPGIFPSERIERLEEGLSQGQVDLVAITYWIRMAQGNANKLPIPSNVMHGLTYASEADFSDIDVIVRKYLRLGRRNETAEELKNALNEHIDSLNRAEQHVENVMERYRSGYKPQAADILHSRDLIDGGSITEPVLQGGTPQEGLTWELSQLYNPTSVVAYDALQNPYGTQGMENFSIKVSSYPLIVRGREISQRYYQFISEMLQRDPSIKTGLATRDTTEKDAALKRYADLEWENRDIALTIANDLKTLIVEQRSYLEGLLTP